MTVTLSAIQGWASQVQATMTALPAELDQAAPTGGFAAVLAAATARVDGGPAAGAQRAAAGQGAGGGTGQTTGPGVPTSGIGASTLGTAPTGGSWSSSVLGTRSLPGVANATGGTTGSGGLGQQAVTEAQRFLGTPYVWGGESPQGFDCSGLVQYVYGKLGVSLPRTSEEQALAGTPVPSLAQAQPGDLVFYAGSDGTASSPGHVGIYLGGGKMIDAPYTGADVRVDPVGQPVAIRRVLPSAALSTAPSTAVPAAAGVTAATMSAPAATMSAPAAGASAGPNVPPNLAPLFVAAAGKYGLPVRLLTAVAYHESRFQTHAVSSAGAEGLMQIMPGTAASLGVTPFTPGQAINGAAQLLSGYVHHFGSVPLALAAYDAGAGAVEQYGGIPPYAETQAYVRTIMQTIGGAA